MSGGVSADRIRCFLLERSTRDRIVLRRYRASEYSKCPGPFGYHNAERAIGTARHSARAVNDPLPIERVPHRDPRWPRQCDGCGYRFTAKDEWDQRREYLYRVTAPADMKAEHTGKLYTLRDAPVGAMWYAPWMEPNKATPDGQMLVVQTPGGDWMVDHHSSTDGEKTGPGWTRIGDVRAGTVTATPSILIGKRKDGSWAYHGFLTNGYLVPT